jgi:hypothetical protein
MHTGQNSIAPKYSLPQLGQVRRGSVVIIYPPVLSRDRSTPGMKPCRALHWRTMIAFHKISVFHPMITLESSLGTKFLKLAIFPCLWR